jgi:hypothetical protein
LLSKTVLYSSLVINKLYQRASVLSAACEPYLRQESSVIAQHSWRIATIKHNHMTFTI